MTKFREILRLDSLGISSRNIAVSLECSRNTIRRVLRRAEEENIKWPLPEDTTDRVLEQTLFGKRSYSGNCKQPDFEYIHKEMAHNGVTLSLLWIEYCDNCKLEGTRPLMYSQFCRRYQEYAAKNKATFHIEYKPGERMEVDAD